VLEGSTEEVVGSCCEAGTAAVAGTPLAASWAASITSIVQQDRQLFLHCSTTHKPLCSSEQVKKTHQLGQLARLFKSLRLRVLEYMWWLVPDKVHVCSALGC
jgi:hypothetical protein